VYNAADFFIKNTPSVKTQFQTKNNMTNPENTPDITLREAQATVDNWIKTVGVRYFNELTNTAILMEEVGEVARLMARLYGEQSFKKSDNAATAQTDLADEMADVLFVLICLANQTGIDLTDALDKNLAKKTRRDRTRHTENEKLRS
jgi:NTP pyrophosphatase (non-canonical NTP hydrolase)